MTSLTERYLAAALRHLPANKRDDVERELRSSIADAVDDRVAGGESPEAAERVVLEGMGDPARLAAGITGRPMYLIGPELFLNYRRLLTLLLSIVVPITAAVLGLLEVARGGGIDDAIGAAISAAINVAIQMTFWVTLIFVLIERADYVKNTNQRPLGGRWTVDDLPKESVNRITIGETVGELITLLITIGGLLVLNGLKWTDTATGAQILILDPSLANFWLPLLIVILVALVGFRIVLHLVGRWTMPMAVAHAVLSLAFAGPLVYLALNGVLVNPAFAARDRLSATGSGRRPGDDRGGTRGRCGHGLGDLRRLPQGCSPPITPTWPAGKESHVPHCGRPRALPCGPCNGSSVNLPDGRTLDVLAGAAGPGYCLLFHHGTPGSATRYETWFAAAEERGLRPLAYSRPGYATSTRDAGRTVASAAADVEALLDQLGIGEFFTLGGSGGGPHSIACAALLPDRCLASAALVTVAPWEADGLDWMAGMTQSNVDEFGAALAGEPALREWMAAEGEEYRQITGQTMVAALGDALPPVDQAVATGEWAEHEAAGIRRALEHGFDGWVDDDLAFARPWGFDPAYIRVPVQIWQGEEDRLVPWSHGEWLANRIPGAHFTLAKGQGHFSLGTANRDQILDNLVDSARPAA